MLTLTLLVLSSSPAVAAPPAWLKVSWKAGPAQRNAFEAPRLVAEVAPDEAGAAAMKAADPDAAPALVRPLVRLWTVAQPAEVHRRLPLALRARFVPVLRDGPTSAAKLTVALGGVVVFLHSSVDRAGWARAHGATAAAAGAFLVPSAPGSAALQLATQLSADPAVRLASPNLWTPGTKR